MKLRKYVLSIAVLLLPACTWVEPTKEGSEVLLVKAFNVEACEKLGTTKTSVKHKVGFVTRSEDKVTEELTTLARNRAAEMGGDSIVARGAVSEGAMEFDIYSCGD
jgi:hypothetical protein